MSAGMRPPDCGPLTGRRVTSASQDHQTPILSYKRAALCRAMRRCCDAALACHPHRRPTTTGPLANGLRPVHVPARAPAPGTCARLLCRSLKARGRLAERAVSCRCVAREDRPPARRQARRPDAPMSIVALGLQRATGHGIPCCSLRLGPGRPAASVATRIGLKGRAIDV